MPAVGGDETTPLRREDGESAIYQRLYILRRGREAGRRSGQEKQAAEHLLCHGPGAMRRSDVFTHTRKEHHAVSRVTNLMRQNGSRTKSVT